LPRLLVLVAVLVVGLGLFWRYARQRPRPVAPAVRVEGHPKAIEPDRSPAFEGVTDRTPMSLRDNAAYALLLERARGRTPEELAKDARRDILMTHLWERPEHYRGVPIHLDGTALRVLRYESKLSRTGWLYEAWIDTPDSRRFPYVCVFESPPQGFPIGPNLSERVVFNGYFLKEMRYVSGNDVRRGAPVLVGRIGWSPGPAPARRDNSVTWMALIVGLMFVISLFRWIAGLRRSLTGGSRAATLARRPTEEIAPEDLDRWVQAVQHDEVEPEEGPEAGDPPR
jgi:hypothetical protein